MPQIPHDLTDLRLAPVALEVDARLESFAAMDRDSLHERVVMESNTQPSDRRRRADAVVRSAVYLVDLGGWVATWDPRGLRLSHEHHTLVLGVPRNVVDYVEELPG